MATPLKNISEIIRNVYVRDIMSKQVFSMDKEETVFSAIEEMSKKSFSSTVIMSSGKPVGIVTEKDLMKKVLVTSKDPKKTKLKEVMSSDLIMVPPSSPIRQASNIMKRHGVRHLLVGTPERLDGILTQTDIIRSFNRIYDNYRYLLWNPKLYLVLFIVLSLIYFFSFFLR